MISCCGLLASLVCVVQMGFFSTQYLCNPTPGFPSSAASPPPSPTTNRTKFALTQKISPGRKTAGAWRAPGKGATSVNQKSNKEKSISHFLDIFAWRYGGMLRPLLLAPVSSRHAAPKFAPFTRLGKRWQQKLWSGRRSRTYRCNPWGAPRSQTSRSFA